MSRAASLADSFDLVPRWLDPVLAGAATVERLRAIARLLPPLHRAGFEVRLDAADPQVDLQQGVFSRDGEPAVLAAFLDAAVSGGERLPPAWRAVRRICDEWQRAGSLLGESLQELWLEIDAIPDADAHDQTGGLLKVLPSVFAKFQRPTGPLETSATLAGQVVRLLVDGQNPAPLLAAVAACAEACSERAWVSHVGVMLGRAVTGCRIHVAGLRVDQLQPYLERIGWPGDGSALTRLASQLFEIVDSIILCLDAREGIQAQLGLECWFTFLSESDPRLDQLLEYLVSKRLCSSAKRDALLRWPGLLLPPEATGPWPESLLLQSLLEPPYRFGVLERRWSHVKLAYVSDRDIRAKAYFGFQPAWTIPAAYEGPGSEPRMPRERPTAVRAVASVIPRPEQVNGAIQKAIGFLELARSQSGFWREFFAGAGQGQPGRFLSETSDEWVTAYVGWVLASGSDARGRAAAWRAWELLAGRRLNEDGWGWNARILPDAESTVWVLRLAESLGIAKSGRVERARAFLLRHSQPDGGLSCYRIEDSALLTGSYRKEGPWSGWCAAHTALTATAAVLDLAPGLSGYLLEHQRKDGAWEDYWWDDDEVATVRAIEALLRNAEPAARGAAQRALRWLATRVGEGGGVRSAIHGGESAFATALCVEGLARGLAAGFEAPELARGLAWLIDAQQDNGSFPPSAWLLAPIQHAIDKRAFPDLGAKSIDHDGIYTTATALAALNAVSELGGVNR